MTYDSPGAGALDYFPCRYGRSRLLFRGPWRPPAARYCAALGGTATYGRFVAHPWPQLLERGSGRMVLNMGVPHAGPDVWLHDPETLALARRAELRILQVPGAVNLSNAFYTVHPRRNDRFLAASPRLRQLYPEVDFTDFAFTRHMIRALAERGTPRFAEVVQVLRACWSERMAALLAALDAPVVLLWCGDRPAPPPEAVAQIAGSAPLLVDMAMLQGLARRASDLVEVISPEFLGDLVGKSCGAFDIAAARLVPGPASHVAIARALRPALARLAA